MSELNLHDGPGLFELKQVHKNAKKKGNQYIHLLF